MFRVLEKGNPVQDEVAEQTATVEADQTIDLTEGQTVEAVPDVQENAGLTDVGAEAQTPVTFDLTTEEGIRAERARNEALDRILKQERDNGFNAGKQNRDAELRREQGTNERAGQTVRWVAEQLQQGVDPDELAKQIAPHVKAHYDTNRLEFGRALLDGADTEEARAWLASIDAEPNPDKAIESAGIALTALKARAEQAGYDRAKAELEAGYAAKLAAELSAQQLEAKTADIQNPPNVSGSPAGTGTVTWDSIDKQFTDSQWLNLPAAERSRLTQLADQARLVGVN